MLHAHQRNHPGGNCKLQSQSEDSPDAIQDPRRPSSLRHLSRDDRGEEFDSIEECEDVSRSPTAARAKSPQERPRSAEVALGAAAAAAEAASEAAAKDRQLELMANQLGRIAIAVSTLILLCIFPSSLT